MNNGMRDRYEYPGDYADDVTEDADYTCGICGCIVTPANLGAWDASDVYCAPCDTQAALDCPALPDPDASLCDNCGAAVPDEAVAGRDGECVFCAVCWPGERAEQEQEREGLRLLNGRSFDDADEETVELAPESMAELVHGRRSEAA
jgi:hypothetical protein